MTKKSIRTKPSVAEVWKCGRLPVGSTKLIPTVHFCQNDLKNKLEMDFALSVLVKDYRNIENSLEILRNSF